MGEGGGEVALVMMVLTISKVRWGASSNSIVLCCNDGGGNEKEQVWEGEIGK
jgi:hypothetical protein